MPRQPRRCGPAEVRAAGRPRVPVLVLSSVPVRPPLKTGPSSAGALGLERMGGGERQGKPGEFSLKKGKRGGDCTAVGSGHRRSLILVGGAVG